MNYLLLGPEEYLKNQFLEKLKKDILGKGRNQPDFEVFYADEKEIAGIINSFYTLPFISKKKLIVIKNFDRFSPKEKTSILKYLKNPRESTVCVLESLSLIPGNKYLEEASKFVKSIRCGKLKGEAVISWIKREFTLCNKKISITSANLLKELLGEDLFSLKKGIEKLISFAGKSGEITSCHIEEVCGKESYKTAFDLVDMVLEKRIDNILANMDDLAIKEKPYQILGLIAWQFRNFLKIKNLPSGLSGEGISRFTGIKVSFLKKALEQSKRFSRAELERKLELILEADLYIKKGIFEARHAVERVLIILCRA